MIAGVGLRVCLQCDQGRSVASSVCVTRFASAFRVADYGDGDGDGDGGAGAAAADAGAVPYDHDLRTYVAGY